MASQLGCASVRAQRRARGRGRQVCLCAGAGQQDGPGHGGAGRGRCAPLRSSLSSLPMQCGTSISACQTMLHTVTEGTFARGMLCRGIARGRTRSGFSSSQLELNSEARAHGARRACGPGEHRRQTGSRPPKCRPRDRAAPRCGGAT